MENFNFATAMEQNTVGAVAYTRTIADPLLGLKLTGKIGRQNVLSGIFALDEYPGDLAAEKGDDERGGRNAAFTILRYKRQMSQDNYVGAFFTNRSFAGDHNTVGGIDARLWIATAVLAGILAGSLALSSWSARRNRQYTMERLYPPIEV